MSWSHRLATAAVLTLLGASAAYAQDRYWDKSGGGGATNNWEDNANWETTETGNTNANDFPDTDTERALFCTDDEESGGGQDAAVNLGVPITIGELRLLNRDYDGTVTLNANLTIEDSGGLSGDFVWVRNGISGNFILSSGVVLTIHGSANFNIEPGAFSNAAGTVRFAGDTAETWTGRTGTNVPNWGNVEVNRTADVLSLGSSITCNDLTLTQGTLDVGAHTLTVQGNLIVRGGATLNIGTGSLVVNGTITVEDGTIDITGASGSIDCGGLVTVGDALATGATLDMGTGNLSTAGGLVVNATDGTFTFTAATPGTLTFDPAAASTVNWTAPAATAFPNVAVNGGNATTSVVTVGAAYTVVSFTATQGTLDLNGNVLTTTGGMTVTANGRVTAGGASGVTFQSAVVGTQTWSDATALPGQNYGAVTIDSAGVVQLAATNVAVTCNSLTLTQGDLDLNGEIINFAGTGITSPIQGLSGTNQIIDSNGGRSTIAFTGTGAAGAPVELPPSGDVTYEALYIQGPAAASPYALLGPITCQTLNVAQGALDLATSRLNTTEPTVAVTIAAPATVTTGANGELECAGDVEVDGTFNGADGTFDVNGLLTNASTGTITMGDGTFECGGDADFSAATFSSTGVFRFDRANPGASQDLVFDTDTFGSFELNESSVSGVFVHVAGGGTATLTLTGLTIIDGVLTLGRTSGGTQSTLDLVVNGATSSADTLTLDRDATFNGNVSVTGGLLTLGSGVVDVNGTFTVGAAAVNQNARPITFSGDVDISAMTATNWTNPGAVTFDEPTGTTQTLSLPTGTLSFADLTVNRPDADDVVSASGTSGTLQVRSIAVTQGRLEVDTNISVPAGPSVVALSITGNGAFECAGDTTARSLALLANDGTDCVTVADGGIFVVSGASHTVTVSEQRRFDVNGTSATVFTVAGGSGTVTLTDTANNATQWVLEVDAGVAFSVLNATVIDSDADGAAAPLIAANATLNDTTDWIRGRIWRGTNASWNDGNNWTGGAAPASDEVAVFDGASSGPFQPSIGVAALPTSGEVGGLIVYGAYTGTITLDADLVLNGALSFDGTGATSQVALQTFRLEVGGNVTLSNLPGAFGTGTGTLVIDKAGATTLSLGGATTIGVGLQVGDTGTNTTISLPQALTVNRLTTVFNGSALTLGGRMLTASGGLVVDGALNASGGTATETSVRTTNLTVTATGAFTDGDENVEVSGNLSVTGGWMDGNGLLIFNGAGVAPPGTSQGWSGATPVGAVAVNSAGTTYVLLGGDVSAASVTVADGETLATGAGRLTVTGLTQVDGTLVGGAGTSDIAVRTAGLTITGTGAYAEGDGDTQVSGALTVNGAWQNDPDGVLVLDGAAQDWTQAAVGVVGANGVGEVSLAGATGTTTLLTPVTVTTLTSAGANNVLALGGQTLTVFGGAANPPLHLVNPGDLTGAGTVVITRPGSSDTRVANLSYPNLQLLRSDAANTALFRPDVGDNIVIAGDLTIGLGATYTTTDDGGTPADRTLSVTGATNINTGGALSAGAANAVALAFASVDLDGDMNLNGGQAVTVTVSGATFDATNGTITQANGGGFTFDRDNQTIALSTGAVDKTLTALTVQDGTDLTIAGGGTVNVTGALTVTGSGTTLVAQSGGTVSAGSLQVTTGSFTAEGTRAVTVSGALQVSSGSFTHSGSGATSADSLTVVGTFSQTGSGSVTAGSATVNGASAQLTTTSGALTLNGALTITQGTVTIGGSGDLNGDVSFGGAGTRALNLSGNATVTLSGDLTMGGGTLTQAAGNTLTLDGGVGAGSQTQTLTIANTTFGGNVNVLLAGNADADADRLEVLGTGTWTVTGTLGVTSGVLSLQRPSTISSATTVAAGGRLENRDEPDLLHSFGSAVTIQDGGEFDFGGASATGLTIRFQAGQLVTVGPGAAALFRVQGGTGSGLITIDRNGASPWQIVASADTNVVVSNVILRDSNNTSVGIDLTASDSVNATPGTTSGWIFPAKTTVWTGLGGDANWTTQANWTLGSPNPGDTANFTQAAANSTQNIDYGGQAIAALLLDSAFTNTLTLAQDLVVSSTVEVRSGSNLDVATRTLTANSLTVATSGDLIAGGAGGTPALDVVNFTLAGTYDEGPRETQVSGDLDTTDATWTDDAAGVVVFDGAGTVATPQRWTHAGAARVGAVRVQGGASTVVRLQSTVNAGDVTIVAANQLLTNGFELNVTGLTDVAGTLTGGGGTNAVRTGGLTVSGTYTEGAGATRVSGDLVVSGLWTNDPAGELIFDGTTQSWDGSGTGLTAGLGEVRLDGAPTTVELINNDARVITLVSAAPNNVLDLNSQTLTVFGNGAVNPPLDLVDADDLTGTGTVVLERTSGLPATLVDALNYHHLQLTRTNPAIGSANYQPQGAITTAGDFTLAANTAYTTADGGAVQRNLTVNGITTIDGALTAAGPVTLTFGSGGGDTTTIGATGSITAGATDTVAMSFALDVTVTGALNLNGGSAVNATFNRDLTVTVTGSLTHTAGTVTFDGGNGAVAVSLGASSSFANVSVVNSTDVTLTGGLVVASAFSISNNGTTVTVGAGLNPVSVGSLTLAGDDASFFNMSASTGTLVVGTGGLTVTRGTVTTGSSGVDINGPITFGGSGTRALTLAGTVNLSDDLNGTGASAFTAPATLLLDGNAQTITLRDAVDTFNAITVSQTGANPTLSIAAGDPSNTLDVTGALQVTSGAVTVGATVTTNLTTATISGGSLTTGANTVTATGLVDVQAAGAVTISGSGVLKPNGGLSVAGAFTNDGVLRFDAGTPTWSTTNGAVTFGAVQVQDTTNLATGSSLMVSTFTQTAGAATVNATHSLRATGLVSLGTGGSFTINATGVLEPQGGLAVDSALTFSNNGLVLFTKDPFSTGDQPWSGNVAFGPVTIDNCVVQAQSNLLAGALTVQNNGQLDMVTFNAPQPTRLTARGNLLANGGVLTFNNNQTLRFEATTAGLSTYTFDAGTSATIGDVETLATGGGVTLKVNVTRAVTIGDTLDVNVNTELEVVTGTFRVQGKTTVYGRLDLRNPARFESLVEIESGGILEVEGSAEFAGSDASNNCVFVDNGGTFQNLVNGAVMSFAAGKILRVSGTINVAPPAITDLQSLTSGAQFAVEIAGGATQTFTNIRVKDSNGNSDGAGTNATATPANSGTELSNVINWNGLLKAEFTWIGVTNDRWDVATNYSGPAATVPFAGARLLFTGSPPNAPRNGTMPDLGEIEVHTSYTPPAGQTAIVFTSAQNLEGGITARSNAVAQLDLAGFTLTTGGNVVFDNNTSLIGAGSSLLSVEGTSPVVNVNGLTLIQVPVRVGDGVATTSATLANPLRAPGLTVSTNSSLSTADFAVTVNGASTIDGDLNAGTSIYTSAGSFDASGGGAVTFGSDGSLRMITNGTTLTVDAADQLGGLQVSASVSQGGATVIDLDGGLTVTGSLTLTSGLNVAGAVDLTGGALVAGTSTVTFDGTGTRTLTLDGQTFHDVVVARGPGNDLDVAGTGLTIGGALTVTSGRLDLTGLAAANPSTVTGAVDVSGTILTGANAFTAGNGLTINGGGATFTGGAAVTVNGAGGLSVATGGTFSAAGFLDVAGGLVANGAVSLTGNGDVDGNVSGGGSVTLGATSLVVGGDWSFSGTQTPGTSTVTFDKAGTAALVGAATERTFYNVTVNGAGVTLAGGLEARRVFVQAGTLSLVNGTTPYTLQLTGSDLNPLQVAAGNFVGFVGTDLGTVDFNTSAGAVPLPALGYGNLTISATGAGTYTASAATTVAGGLSLNGVSGTVLASGADLTVTGAAAVAANNTLRMTAGNTTLRAASIDGAGTLDLGSFTLTVALTGGGVGVNPLSVTTVSGLAEGATVDYRAACTVRSGIVYGRLLLSSNSGTYALPAGNLDVRGDALFTGGTSAATTILRIAGNASSTFSCQSALALQELEITKPVASTVFLQGPVGVSRQIGVTEVLQGNLDIQASVTLTGPNVIGQAAAATNTAQLFVQTPGVILTIGATTLHTNMLVGQGQLGVGITFTVGTTLALQGNANLSFAGNTNDKLEIRSSAAPGNLGPGFRSFITAAGTTFSITATDVDVQNNDCSAILDQAYDTDTEDGITAQQSNDSGGTLGWIFLGGGNIIGVRATGVGDGAGRLTKVQVLYNGDQALNAATVGNAHVGYELLQLGPSGQPSVTVAGTSAAILNTTSGRVLEVTFGSGLGKTDTRDVRVRYSPPATNRLTNTASRPASVSFSLDVVDGAEPVLIGTSFQDADGNGAIDRGVFFFSEEVGFTGRRGVSISGTNPATSTATLGANTLLTLRIAGETLPAIDLASQGLRPTGDLIAALIQTQVRNYLNSPPGTHDPLNRPAILNFSAEFVDGRYVLRAGVPVRRVAGAYVQDYTASTVVVVTGGANDAADSLRLGLANDGVERAGAGDAAQGMLVSEVVPPDNVSAGPSLSIGLNGEDTTISVTGLSNGSTIENVARQIETALRATSLEPQHSSNAGAYAQFVAVPDRANGRLVLISGSEGTGSSVAVDTTVGLGTSFVTADGAVSSAGRSNTATQLDDLNVLAATGRNLLLGRNASHVVASGSTITVEFTNQPGDGTAAPRFVWQDDGDLGFVADEAPVVNRTTTAISNTAGGELLLVSGDDDGDRQLESQAPGAGALDVSQSVPPLGAVGSSMSLTWTFVEFIDPTTNLPDAAVTAGSIGLAGTTSTRPTFTARRAGTYRFSLTAQVLNAAGTPVATPFTDGQGRIVTTVEYVVVDANPVADAGADQTVVGLVVTLDATASTDPNLDPPGNTTLSVDWSAVDQNGAAVAGGAFSASTGTMAAAGTPTFTAPNAGVFTITATVYKTADTTKRATDTVRVTCTTTTDLLPTADAGDDVVRRVGELVTLDGRRSRDPEGQALIYRWTFASGPAAVTLGGDSTDRPTWTPSLAGSYVFELVVDDGVFTSPTDQVTVQVVDDLAAQPRRAPGAVARLADVRRGVFLTAAPSTNWERSVEVLMADGTRRRPVAVDLIANAADDPAAALIQGALRLDVFDAALAVIGRVYVRVDEATAADPVELVELGGGEARVLPYGVAGEAFVLDATRSQDDGSIRTFTWTQVAGPTAFSTQTGSLVTVVPVTGTYAFDLVVTDATNLSSLPARVTVPVVPAAATSGPPTARIDGAGGATEVAGAGTPWSPLVCVGTANVAASLTGTASQSHNGAPIATYAWSQVSGPMALLTGETTDTLGVTGKTAGVYRFALTVTDSVGVSSTAEVWLTLAASGQTAPVARIDGAASRIVALSATGVDLNLTGQGSTGAEPRVLEWGQTDGVPLVIETTTGGAARVRVSQPGTYVFTLRVTDANGVTSAPATVAVWALGQGDTALASGASTSESSGGCALTPSGRPGGGAPGLVLLALGLALVLGRRRAS